jgi:hypothetical protein
MSYMNKSFMKTLVMYYSYQNLKCILLYTHSKKTERQKLVEVHSFIEGQP